MIKQQKRIFRPGSSDILKLSRQDQAWLPSTSIIRAVSLSANDRIMMNLYFEQANGLAWWYIYIIYCRHSWWIGGLIRYYYKLASYICLNPKNRTFYTCLNKSLIPWSLARKQCNKTAFLKEKWIKIRSGVMCKSTTICLNPLEWSS